VYCYDMARGPNAVRSGNKILETLKGEVMQMRTRGFILDKLGDPFRSIMENCNDHSFPGHTQELVQNV
jgi:hypothetical protein